MENLKCSVKIRVNSGAGYKEDGKLWMNLYRRGEEEEKTYLWTAANIYFGLSMSVYVATSSIMIIHIRYIEIILSKLRGKVKYMNVKYSWKVDHGCIHKR